MVKKFTQVYVKDALAVEKYTLLDTYKNSNTKFTCKCPKGHLWSVTFGNWGRGIRCPYCSGNYKHTYEEIKHIFVKEGYTLLSSTYSNNKQKLSYRCPEGHESTTRFDNWVAGHRCPYCAGQGKPSIEYISESFLKEGYILLSSEYVNSRTKLAFVCPNKHQGYITYSSWSSGCRCTYCAHNIQLSIDYIRSKMEEEDYKLLSTTYRNNKTVLDYICSKGHYSKTTWSDWNAGYRCKFCYYESMHGANNPAWSGGNTLSDYCDIWKDKEYKDSIKIRDGYRCSNPSCYKRSKNLVIHHIDYDKQNCHPDNLITLCIGCNGSANTNRDWHIIFYRTLLTNKYGYIY